MVGSVKLFNDDETNKKTMSFNVADKKLLKKYIKIWEKISSLLNKEFDGDPVYGGNDKSIKTKIKQYKDKINTNFQGKKIPKENVPCKCLSLKILEYVHRMNNKYNPQTF